MHFFLPAADLARFSVSCFSANASVMLNMEEGYDAGIEGVICSSSAVSRVIKILNDWIEENIGITTCDVDERSGQCRCC